MINSRMRMVDEKRGRELAAEPGARVVAQLRLQKMNIIAGRFAGWISPNTADAADREFLR